MEDDEEEMKKMEDAKCGLATELTNLKSEYDKLKAELANLRTDLVKAARVAKLVAAGLSQEEADAKASIFVALSDEQFDGIVAIAASLKTPAKDATEAEIKTETTKAEDAESELKASSEDQDIDGTVATEKGDELSVALASYYETKLVKQEKK